MIRLLDWIDARWNAITAHIERHVVGWALFGIIIYLVFQYADALGDLRHVCDLTGQHDIALAHPITPRQRLDAICISHEDDGGDDSSEPW